MKKPVLVVMAAGMGNRYGGLKQIDPISEQGEIIIDFSLYDAMMAGFEEVVFIIKKEIEEDMHSLLDGGAGRHLKLTYVFQELEDLPPGYEVPSGRTKPWGTCHAVLAAKGVVDGNFVVINADDYYGAQAFQLIYDELLEAKDGEAYDYSMVGYRLANTLTEHGHVSRGVCALGEDGKLARVDERLKIMWKDGPGGGAGVGLGDGADGSKEGGLGDGSDGGTKDGTNGDTESGSDGGTKDSTDGGTKGGTENGTGRTIQYEDENGSWHEVPPDSTVSMNFWGFTPSFFKELEEGFPAFLDGALKDNPMKGEYLLPRKIDELLKSGKATVKVLPTGERWFGVTYREDREHVAASVRAMKDKGLYPEKLWST